MTEVMTHSSIGACWPPQEASQERIRGFYDEAYLDNPREVAIFAERYQDTVEQMHATPGVSRVSIRAVASSDMVAELERQGVPVEAAVRVCWPVGHRGITQPYPYPSDALVYVGENSPERNVPGDRDRTAYVPREQGRGPLASSREQLDMLLRQTNEQLGRSGQSQIAFEVVRGAMPEPSEQMVQGLNGLFLPFGYDEQGTRSILEDDGTHLVLAVNEDGDIVSSAMAEVASVTIQGLGNLVMAEITEASTRPDYRGRGIYRIASGLLLLQLGLISRQNSMLGGDGVPNVIFGECNMSERGVILASERNGRWASLDDAPTYADGSDVFENVPRVREGRASFGILPGNFRVENGQPEGGYNDFMPTFVNHGQMLYLRSDAAQRRLER